MTSLQTRLLSLGALVVAVPLAACAERARKSETAAPAAVEVGSVADASPGARGPADAAAPEAPEPRTVDAGTSRRAPNPVARPKDAAGCDALLASAQADLDAARARTSDACGKDDDCVTTSFRACVSDCGSRAIAKHTAADYEAARADVTEGKCRPWFEAPCMRLTPKPTPSCSMYRPACVNGRCVAIDSWPKSP